MIASFGDRLTEDLYHGRMTARARRFPAELMTTVVRKLDMINASVSLNDLRSPPGNRLEALRGDLQDFHSIRVNDQWRIVFRWEGTEAHQVHVTDYH